MAPAETPPSSSGAELSHPTHLDPSELGTKEYWDAHYTTDITAHAHDDAVLPDPTDLESWFDDVDAPAKILDFLGSESFPLSPNHVDASGAASPGVSMASVLDLGTGNGASLFALRLQAKYHGLMVGVDYSPQSIELARRLGQGYADPEKVALGEDYDAPPAEEGVGCDGICFEVFDVLRDDPEQQPWWPGSTHGFDLVLDKGTFDAVSLSAETVRTPTGKEERVCNLYPRRAIGMVRPGGFLLVTSCNWTESEVVRWFTSGEGVQGELEVWDRIQYPVYEFGGQKGQGVASVCFRRKRG